ncbi:hypothetical protein BABINDRAFT_160942 [Babjeviella inositovora NRRL Y-12698]|uniref:Dipeptidyl-aminopeptidase B n=1 Tax=Babjeviella inositovora NRRL Y-12698 TaxID=984486 RepID=A0A1E3QSN3_9ASCO|nr:uncharacterized protein BABINDRAFT_160942 [Babjeviella inositovora NRRL Y-12698]ODQ80715.1 hypothetical protein BABINDRAFT_160942 [Babjeviella inositovora NRRL Y-12698]
MFSGLKAKDQSYELVDNPANLGPDIELSAPGPSDPDDMSTTSIVLERINAAADQTGAEDFRTRNAEFLDSDREYINNLYGKQRVVPRKYLIWTVAVFAVLWAMSLFAYLSGPLNHDDFKPTNGTSVKPGAHLKGLKPYTMSDYLVGALFPYGSSYDFVPPQGHLDTNDDEGLHSMLLRNSIVVRKVANDTFELILLEDRFVLHNGVLYYLSTVAPLYDLSKMILGSSKIPMWRHSSNAKYFLMDIASKKVTPIQYQKEGDPREISFAKWSSLGKYISFVQDNNIYIMDATTGEVTPVTSDGTLNIINGKPDWVYEEEVLAQESALWWSPDDTTLTFLKTNDTNVPIYDLDYYIRAGQYPEHLPLKYPKPGYSNPIVSVLNYDLASGKSSAVSAPDLGEDFVVYSVQWIDAQHLMLKQTDRTSSTMMVRVYDAATHQTTTTRTFDGVEKRTWTEKAEPVLLVPRHNVTGYVDLVIVDDFPHLAYFPNATATQPVMLTSGKWEVPENAFAYDSTTQLVYFKSPKNGVMELKIASVNVTGDASQSVVYVTPDEGHYSASASHGGRFLHAKNEGPDVPHEYVMDTLLHASLKEAKALPSRTDLLPRMKEFALPTKNYYEVELDETMSDGSPVTLSVMEILPPNFDASKKYPLLASYYAGPGSKNLFKKFEYGFNEAVSSSMDAVVLYIEPRGTGAKGYEFRRFAYDRIGHYEPRDITTVAQKWIAKGFIDVSKTACWGWSYGGFTTLKVLEYDGGRTFKYGMAVAPVTDWRFYDSIYTERYMHLPIDNQVGYLDVSVVKNMTGFANVTRFLVMHGTADDNVHLQNTMVLLDKFDTAGLDNYDMHVFPDSNHSIYFHNGQKMVWERLTHWLTQAFGGKFETF